MSDQKHFVLSRQVQGVFAFLAAVLIQVVGGSLGLDPATANKIAAGLVAAGCERQVRHRMKPDGARLRIGRR